MASLHQHIDIHCSAAQAWAALRDVGALHTKLVRGFVTDCRLEGTVRVVSFANGLVAREQIVDIDDIRQRVVWSAQGGRLQHHNAAAQVQALDADHCRVSWVADLLPDEMAAPIAGMIEAGLAAMKQTLESAPHAPT